MTDPTKDAVEALRTIRDQDYRGHPCQCSNIARRALLNREEGGGTVTANWKHHPDPEADMADYAGEPE